MTYIAKGQARMIDLKKELEVHLATLGLPEGRHES